MCLQNSKPFKLLNFRVEMPTDRRAFPMRQDRRCTQRLCGGFIGSQCPNCGRAVHREDNPRPILPPPVDTDI